MLTDLTLDGSAVIARAPDAVPDVFAGSPVVAAVRLGAGELVVRGRTADGDWERRLRVGMPRPGDGDPAIVALFGRERVADLEARSFGGERCDAEIERLGVAFQIATRLTAFVAVDEIRAARPAVRHEVVPQEVPYGTTAAAFGLRPATGPREFLELMLASASMQAEPDEFVGASSAEPDLAGLPFDDGEVRAFEASRAGGGVVKDELEDDYVDIARSVAIDASEHLDEDAGDYFDLESSKLLPLPGEFEEAEREIVDPELVMAQPAIPPPAQPAKPTGRVITAGLPAAPPEPPNPRANRIARARRAMRPRGVAAISREKSAPPEQPPEQRPEQGPMKTWLGGPLVVDPKFGLASAIGPAKPVPPASVDKAKPVPPGPVQQPRLGAPALMGPGDPPGEQRGGQPGARSREQIERLEAMAARAWDEPTERAAPAPRRGWPVLLAILALLAALAALLWWLVL